MNGEFKWSPELLDLLKGMRGRFGELLKYPRGLTPEEREAIISQATEGVKAAERPRLASMRTSLARMGLSGIPAFEIPEEQKIRRETSKQVAGVRGDIAIDEMTKRFQELTGSTEVAGNLMNRLFTAEQLPEVLSGGRRREGFEAISQLLNYLSLLMGGQQGMLSPLVQALMARMGTTGGEGADWLPYAGYLLGGTL